VSRNRLLGVAASASLLLTLFVVLPGIGADEKEKSARESLYRPLGLFTEVLSLVRGNYVEEADTAALEGASPAWRRRWTFAEISGEEAAWSKYNASYRRTYRFGIVWRAG
jgi:hypothetical protein